jgi:putative transposase
VVKYKEKDEDGRREIERTRPWEVSDALWERVRPLIPQRQPHPKGGRPANDDRTMFAAIVYVLRTGVQWNALPRELGASTTVYDRFRLWEKQGFFDRIWQAGLQDYDELVGIDWQWQSLDGVKTKAPLGGGATGANPTDRGKRGTKRSELSDGRGFPLAIAVAGANRHDMKLVEATLDSIIIERPEPTQEQPQHLCLDAGYDYEEIFEAARTRHYVPHIRPNRYNRAYGKPEREEPEEHVSNPLEATKKPRRWVVERLHSWLNRSRRVLVRWEKLTQTYEAFLHLACALICFQQCDRFRSCLVSE